MSELSRRKRASLRAEILGVHALLEWHGQAALVRAMAQAELADAYGVDYLTALLRRSEQKPAPQRGKLSLVLSGVPSQAEIDRQLALYEAYVHVERAEDLVAAGAAR